MSAHSHLTSAQWLADHLGAEGLVVLDATVLDVASPVGGRAWLSGYDQYLVEGHIPGALFAEVLEAFSDPAGGFAFTRPSAEQFDAATAALGIGTDSTVVVYDSSIGQWASRLWWLFRSFGFESISVLDGGLTAWRGGERPLEFGHVPAVAVTPDAALEATALPGFWADKTDVEAVIAGDRDATLVCSLPPSDFAGETGSRSRLGHIPGSVNVPSGRLVQRDDRTLLRGDALAERLAPATGSKEPIILYCGAGIAATLGALALTLEGRTDVAVYDGSLGEWAADADAPLATTSATAPATPAH
ncbi:rhodanese-like domain-containing protein [Leifsonia sp. YIM 134122]|uniref:Rhodanese-like domain-containing protein n=1 Tax=Leifsonia stereocauli TaxID=3134136 RepID=A0ABU9VZU0_9MICO